MTQNTDEKPAVDPLQMFSCADIEALLRLKRAAARKLMDEVGIVRINGRPRVMRQALVLFLERTAFRASGGAMASSTPPSPGKPSPGGGKPSPAGCPRCGKVLTAGRRADTVYCRSACRQATYKRRKRASGGRS